MSRHLRLGVSGIQRFFGKDRLMAAVTASALLLGSTLLVVPNESFAGPATALSGKAPAFTLPSSTGASDSLANHKGEVVMLNFWASWCEPCRTEFPLLDGLYKKYKKLGFTVLAVNIEPDAKAAQGFLKNMPVSFPVLLDAKNSVSESYKVDAMPTTVLVDRAGNMRFLHRGYQPGYEAEYEKNIRALLRE
jgi:thiol-disulfide isomerase/thioredoxin